MRSRNCGLLATLALGLLLSQPARASISFDIGNNPFPDEENILFTLGDTGTDIFGVTNNSGVNVLFHSTESLQTNGSGQADIRADDGLVNNVSVIIPGGFYDGLILNPLNGSGPAHVTVHTNLDHFFDYNLGNGQNFLTITTSGGEHMTSVVVDAVQGFDRLKQPRIGGVGINSNTPPSNTPEPASLGLLGLGVLPILRRKFRKS